jgi:hypothetical protein
MNESKFSQGDKIVCNGIAGSFWQYLGDDKVVMLLGAPQSDGAMTMVLKLEDVELVKSAPKKSPRKKPTSTSSKKGALGKKTGGSKATK